MRWVSLYYRQSSWVETSHLAVHAVDPVRHLCMRPIFPYPPSVSACLRLFPRRIKEDRPDLVMHDRSIGRCIIRNELKHMAKPPRWESYNDPRQRLNCEWWNRFDIRQKSLRGINEDMGDETR
jgi:hypothetical protein